jgi:competence protein ComGC
VSRSIDKKNRNIKSFTLIEMLIAMGVMSMVLLIISNLVMTSIKVNYKVDARRRLVQDLEVVLKVIQRDIKSADTIKKVGNQLKYRKVDGQWNSYELDGTNLERDQVAVNMSRTKVNSFEIEIVSLDDFGNSVVVVTINASPEQSQYIDDIEIVKQAVAYTESYEMGF